jgi:hypothetical protein
MSLQAQNIDVEPYDTNVATGIDGLATSMPMTMTMPVGFDDQSLSFGPALQNDFTAMRPEMYNDLTGQAPILPDMSQLDWTAFGGRANWPGF